MAWKRFAVLGGCAGALLFLPSASGHGTINSVLLGQSAEHEKITRGALACAPGYRPKDLPGRCFEPDSIDQLAGTSRQGFERVLNSLAGLAQTPTTTQLALVATNLSFLKLGTFGGVGAADMDGFFEDVPHCTDADYFLTSPLPGLPGGYPRTLPQRDAALAKCRASLRKNWAGALAAANGLVDQRGVVVPGAIDIKDCRYIDGRKALDDLAAYTKTLELHYNAAIAAFGTETYGRIKAALAVLRVALHVMGALSDPGPAGPQKCLAINYLGRMFHGMQDFYSHSNWADSADPKRPIGIDNPAGLASTGRAPLLAMTKSAMPPLPPTLTTSCYDLAHLLGQCKGRIDHDRDLGKDEGDIHVTLKAGPLPNTLTTANPTTPRGKITLAGRTNFDRGVQGAVDETVGAWTDFGKELQRRYGKVRGERMICALTHDDPVKDCKLVCAAVAHAAPARGPGGLEVRVRCNTDIDDVKVNVALDISGPYVTDFGRWTNSAGGGGKCQGGDYSVFGSTIDYEGIHCAYGKLQAPADSITTVTFTQGSRVQSGQTIRVQVITPPGEELNQDVTVTPGR